MSYTEIQADFSRKFSLEGGAGQFRVTPLSFGPRRYRTGLVARRSAEDLAPVRRFEEIVRDFALEPNPLNVRCGPEPRIRRMRSTNRTIMTRLFPIR